MFTTCKCQDYLTGPLWGSKNHGGRAYNPASHGNHVPFLSYMGIVMNTVCVT